MPDDVERAPSLRASVAAQLRVFPSKNEFAPAIGKRVQGHHPIAHRHHPMVAEPWKRVPKAWKRVPKPWKRVLRHLETCFRTREMCTRIPGSANRDTGNVFFHPGKRVREPWKRGARRHPMYQRPGKVAPRRHLNA